MEVTVLKAMVMMMTSMIPAFSMTILMIPNPVPTTMKMKMEGGCVVAEWLRLLPPVSKVAGPIPVYVPSLDVALLA